MRFFKVTSLTDHRSAIHRRNAGGLENHVIAGAKIYVLCPSGSGSYAELWQAHHCVHPTRLRAPLVSTGHWLFRDTSSTQVPAGARRGLFLQEARSPHASVKLRDFLRSILWAFCAVPSTNSANGTDMVAALTPLHRACPSSLPCWRSFSTGRTGHGEESAAVILASADNAPAQMWLPLWKTHQADYRATMAQACALTGILSDLVRLRATTRFQHGLCVKAALVDPQAAAPSSSPLQPIISWGDL